MKTFATIRMCNELVVIPCLASAVLPVTASKGATPSVPTASVACASCPPGSESAATRPWPASPRSPARPRFASSRGAGSAAQTVIVSASTIDGKRKLQFSSAAPNS